MIYCNLAIGFGWPPATVDRLTLHQAAMLLEAASPSGACAPASRADDWSQFGLKRRGTKLHGPLADLEAYAAYRRDLEAKGKD